MEEQLPFLAYGTLRPGQYNHGLIEPLVETTIFAELTGAQMWAGPGFPYVLLHDQAPTVVSRESKIIGDLVYIKPRNYSMAIRNMDRLEGIASGHYRRVKVTVTTVAGDEAKAWIYVAGSAVAQDLYSRPERVISSGNWVEFVESGTYNFR
jgi:gamma-glutamylcyclotransferase (GGCT)/AIG2-like uncharacterized protein YtfP